MNNRIAIKRNKTCDNNTGSSYPFSLRPSLLINVRLAQLSIITMSLLFTLGCGQANQQVSSVEDTVTKADNKTIDDNLSAPKVFFERIMNVAPILPSNMTQKTLSCGNVNNSATPQRFFRPEQRTNYTDAHWDTRISRNWDFFDIPRQDGKVLVIDFKQANDTIGYRYLANDKTQTDIYEPWSSSKIQAFTGAVASIRKQNSAVGATATIGDVNVADMIASINSYAANDTSNDDSNALANFFANVAGRDFLTALFFDDWLRLSNQQLFFRGAYGANSFAPASDTWASSNNNSSVTFAIPESANQDPGYLPYNCEQCGKTGNKPMSTLLQAEWLKRLATHERSKQTPHPFLEVSDINVLFYDGMTQGISNMLQIAIANAISNANTDTVITTPQRAKQVLDQNTQGKWRVFQKIGWGNSETRSQAENVVLAHVCLPHYQGGREFTVSAQASIPLDNLPVSQAQEDEYLGLAGMQMQKNLNSAMKALLNHPSAL